jgi:hypothetical protein
MVKDVEQSINLKESSSLTLDIKSLVGIIAILLSVAGVYFKLTGEISQLQLDVVRMLDSVEINSEFRIMWPRGEMGALPDDAKQDLRIEYLQSDVEKLMLKLEKHITETDRLLLGINK